MRFERRVYYGTSTRVRKAADVETHKANTSEVTGDVISFRTSCAAILPFASETKVVSALSADVVVAEVVVEEFGVGIRLSAVDPKAGQGRFVGGIRDWGWLLFGRRVLGRGRLGDAIDSSRLLVRGGGGCCGHGEGESEGDGG